MESREPTSSRSTKRLNMSNDDAIAETAAKAKQLLFKSDGKLKGPDQFVALFIMQFVVRLATDAETLNPQLGQFLFDWHDRTHAYSKGIGDLLLGDAKAGDAFSDRVLCGSAAIILDAVGGVPDQVLRSYVCGRLNGGLPTLTKRGRGKGKAENSYRDAVIVGWLIIPLLDRYNPTRNDATKQSDKARSACSIVTEALARAGVHMSEKRVEEIWGRFSRILAK